MSRPSMNVAILALLLLSFGAEAAVTLARKQTKDSPEINPPLKDVRSDKKFFGPPFPADYPDDRRPAINKKLLDQVKEKGQPYPALQSKADYDTDYVKDENNDKGAWQAQFEYDRLRKKLGDEEGDEKRAQDHADKEGGDVNKAQKDDDDAQKGVDDAQKGVDGAKKDEDDMKTAGDFDGPPSREKLKELEKAVKEAEERYEKQKKAFEECKRQLEEAEKELKALQEQQKAMEEKLNADTELYVAKKDANEKQAAAVKLNIQRKKDEKQKIVSAKVQAAQDKLSAAAGVKAKAENALAKEKAEHEQAKNNLAKQKADVTNLKKQIDTAGSKLQKLNGYEPAVVPGKSGAFAPSSVAVAFASVAVVLAVQFL